MQDEAFKKLVVEARENLLLGDDGHDAIHVPLISVDVVLMVTSKSWMLFRFSLN